MQSMARCSALLFSTHSNADRNSLQRPPKRFWGQLWKEYRRLIPLQETLNDCCKIIVQDLEFVTQVKKNKRRKKIEGVKFEQNLVIVWSSLKNGRDFFWINFFKYCQNVSKINLSNRLLLFSYNSHLKPNPKSTSLNSRYHLRKLRKENDENRSTLLSY